MTGGSEYFPSVLTGGSEYYPSVPTRGSEYYPSVLTGGSEPRVLTGGFEYNPRVLRNLIVTSGKFSNVFVKLTRGYFSEKERRFKKNFESVFISWSFSNTLAFGICITELSDHMYVLS